MGFTFAGKSKKESTGEIRTKLEINTRLGKSRSNIRERGRLRENRINFLYRDPTKNEVELSVWASKNGKKKKNQ